MGNCFNRTSEPKDKQYEKYRICSNNHQLVKRCLYFVDVNLECIDVLCYIPYEYQSVDFIPEKSLLITSLECPARIDIRWKISKRGTLRLLSMSYLPDKSSDRTEHEMQYGRSHKNVKLQKVLDDYINHLNSKGVQLQKYFPPMIGEAYI